MVDPQGLRCPSCGGPLTLAMAGDSIILHSTVLLSDDGGVAEQEARGDWCPPCQREWEQAARA